MTYYAPRLRALFWHVDDNLFDIDRALVRSREALFIARGRNADEGDIKLIEQAIQYQQDAAMDLLWRSMMMREEVPYRVTDFPPLLRPSWTRLDYSLHSRGITPPFFMHPTFISTLRETVAQHPEYVSNEERMIAVGDLASAKDRARDAYITPSPKGKLKPTKHATLEGITFTESRKKLKIKEAKPRSKPTGVIPAIDSVMEDVQPSYTSTHGSIVPIFSPAILSSPSLHNAQVRESCSSKVNYIISEVKGNFLGYLHLNYITLPVVGPQILSKGEIPHFLRKRHVARACFGGVVARRGTLH